MKLGYKQIRAFYAWTMNLVFLKKKNQQWKFNWTKNIR